ncbi:hypothetical protein D3C73_1053900 [compost metagenome]
MTVGATLPAAAEKLMADSCVGGGHRGVPSARALVQVGELCLVRVAVLGMGSAEAGVGPVLVPMVHQGRHAVDQHHAHTHQQ